MSDRLRARALMAIAGAKIEKASRHVAGFEAIKAGLGITAARWAYADRGTTLDGHRVVSASEKALAAWRPSASDWAIVLSGNTGSGKTIAAARYVAELGGLLLTATEADTWGFGGGRLLRAATRATWALVDDIGTERTAPGVANLTTLVTDRSRAGLRTVFTTNLSLDQFLTVRGDHLTSRLRPHFRSLAAGREPDRRSTVEPLMRGLTKQVEIHRAAAAVRMIADGMREQGDAALAELARLTGVDLDGDAFASRLEHEEAEADKIADLMAEASLAFERLVSSTVEPLTQADEDALAWLDDQDGSEDAQ